MLDRVQRCHGGPTDQRGPGSGHGDAYAMMHGETGGDTDAQCATILLSGFLFDLVVRMFVVSRAQIFFLNFNNVQRLRMV